MALLNFLSQEELRNKILNKWVTLEPNINVKEDSQIYMDADAIAEALFSIQVDSFSLSEEAFIAFATGDRLSNLGLERGFPRKEATFARGELKFSRAAKATSDFPLPVGTEVSTQPATDGTTENFITDTAVTLIGILTVPSNLGLSTQVTGGGLGAVVTNFYKVTARDALGQETDASAEISITTGGGATNLNILTWDAVVEAVDYRVYVGPTSGTNSLIATVTVPTYSHVSGSGDATNFPPVTNSTGATEVLVDATAKVAGDDGNVPVGSVNKFVDQPAGIEIVANIEAMAGGADEESDTAYRDRLQQAFIFGSAASKTTKTGYEQTALGVSGVVTATVVSNPNPVNKNVFDMYITSSELDTGLPSATLVAAVQTEVNLDENRSPNDIITVLAPTPVSVNVTSTILDYAEGFGDEASVRQAVRENVSNYLNELPTGTDVRLVDVQNAVHDTPGVADFNVTLPAANVVITATQKAIAGSITIL